MTQRLESIPLGELCTIQSGGTPRRNVREFYEGSIPWAKIADLDSATGYVYKTEEHISEAGLKSIGGRLFPVGTILFAMYGSIGKTAIATTNIVTNQAILGIQIIKPNLIDSRYLYRWLLKMQSTFENMGRGVTQKNLSATIVRSLKIPLPPLEQQKRIAMILDKADELRGKRRQAIAKLDELLQSVFLEVFGDPVTNPKKWSQHHLPDLLVKPPQNGAYFPKEFYTENASEGIEMIHMSDAFYDIVSIGNLKRVKASNAEIQKYSVTEKDLLIARRSLNYEGAAKPCLIPQTNEPLLFESSLIRITPSPTQISTIYLFYYLSNQRVRENFIYPYITKSTISGINQSGLGKIKITVPELDQQKKFESIVSESNYQIDKMKEHLALEELLFSSLQHRAFRGEL
jgi:type I restriction enzyme, S subunit